MNKAANLDCGVFVRRRFDRNGFLVARVRFLSPPQSIGHGGAAMMRLVPQII